MLRNLCMRLAHINIASQHGADTHKADKYNYSSVAQPINDCWVGFIFRLVSFKKVIEVPGTENKIIEKDCILYAPSLWQ